jgi:hypothetical protein
MKISQSHKNNYQKLILNFSYVYLNDIFDEKEINYL